ncbi:hypothetical protein Q3G72_009729 [Acer saccharum]|nr:hypothetical protein Q3G72_009729 [Acer saccharum]
MRRKHFILYRFIWKSVPFCVHVSGAGDFQLCKIEILKDPFPMNARKEKDAIESDETHDVEVLNDELLPSQRQWPVFNLVCLVPEHRRKQAQLFVHGNEALVQIVSSDFKFAATYMRLRETVADLIAFVASASSLCEESTSYSIDSFGSSNMDHHNADDIDIEHFGSDMNTQSENNTMSVSGPQGVGGSQSKVIGKKPKMTSNVWQVFDLHESEDNNGNKIQSAICKLCNAPLVAGARNGTNHLKRHMEKCLAKHGPRDPKQQQLAKASGSGGKSHHLV